jgi:hypothetical protein
MKNIRIGCGLELKYLFYSFCLTCIYFICSAMILERVYSNKHTLFLTQPILMIFLILSVLCFLFCLVLFLLYCNFLFDLGFALYVIKNGKAYLYVIYPKKLYFKTIPLNKKVLRVTFDNHFSVFYMIGEVGPLMIPTTLKSLMKYRHYFMLR